jgi:signal transduction histidine kinase
MLEALADAADGVERVGGIVRHLTDLSRVDSGVEVAPVDLHAVLDACAAMTRGQLERRATLVREFGEVPEVLGERSQLIQVFLNLLLNAAQAIPEGNPSGHTVRLATRPDGEVGVVVEVVDSGCGIPAAVLDRIWDPFFTTKPLGEGTGLGLTICRKIVARLGGRVSVRSREGAGSTFGVWLKAAPAAGLAVAPSAAEDEDPLAALLAEEPRASS